MKLTKAQARALEILSPRLPFYGARRDWRGVRRDVRDRLWRGGYLSTPNQNRDGSRMWELTPSGRAALNTEQGGAQ